MISFGNIIPYSARLVPLFKAGDKSIFSNNYYRPISVLPFSKILEKRVCNGIIDYLSKYKILSYSQFGFNKHYSTEYILYDKICFAINSNEVTDGIFSDLSKASYSVNHQNSF